MTPLPASPHPSIGGGKVRGWWCPSTWDDQAQEIFSDGSHLGGSHSIQIEIPENPLMGPKGIKGFYIDNLSRLTYQKM